MCLDPLEAYTPSEVMKTRLLKLVETAYTIAKQTFARYSSKYSKKTYTQWQHAVIDVHVTTTRKHDTKIAPTLVQRNDMRMFLADKGYDATALRKRCHAQGIRPLIRYREFTPLQAAWNARMDDALYQQRNLDETVYSTIKRRFGSAIASRTWWKQFKEIVVKCIAHNLEKAVGSPVPLKNWYPPVQPRHPIPPPHP